MINRVTLIGNIANELEIETTQTGKNRMRFTLAVNKGYGDKKVASFIPCVAWEKTAELIKNYCRKGLKILSNLTCLLHMKKKGNLENFKCQL